MVALFNYRKYLDTQQYYLMHYKGRVLRPTPRTIESNAGFSVWLKWAEEEEEAERESNESFEKRHGEMPLSAGYERRFDHLIWDEQGDLAMYNTDWESPLYLDIISFSEMLRGSRDVSVYVQKSTPKKAPEAPVEVFGDL